MHAEDSPLPVPNHSLTDPNIDKYLYIFYIYSLQLLDVQALQRRGGDGASLPWLLTSDWDSWLFQI